jgi:hypothetical protein
MKFVILVKATKASEAGAMPSEEDLAGVLAYNQELVRAGVMLDGVGLSPTSEGFRIRFSAEGRTVIEGPFDDENLVAGFWLIEVASRDEAMRWAMKIPNTAVEGEYGEIEVRRVFELDEFEPDPPSRASASSRRWRASRRTSRGPAPTYPGLWRPTAP